MITPLRITTARRRTGIGAGRVRVCHLETNVGRTRGNVHSPDEIFDGPRPEAPTACGQQRQMLFFVRWPTLTFSRRHDMDTQNVYLSLNANSSAHISTAVHIIIMNVPETPILEVFHFAHPSYGSVDRLVAVGSTCLSRQEEILRPPAPTCRLFRTKEYGGGRSVFPPSAKPAPWRRAVVRPLPTCLEQPVLAT